MADDRRYESLVRSKTVNLINDITLDQRRFSSYRRKEGVTINTLNKLKTDVQYLCKWFLSLSKCSQNTGLFEFMELEIPGGGTPI